MPILETLVSVFFLAGVGAAEPPEGPTALRVCARPNAGFLQTQAGPRDGEEIASGLELDLLEGFARDHDVAIDLVWLDSFGDLLPGVLDGECDIASAGIMITEDRARQVAFSEPYFPVRVVLVGSRDSTAHSAATRSRATVAVVSGTIHEEIARSLGVAEIVLAANETELFAQVSKGRADLAICDSAIILPFLDRFPRLQIVDALSERSFFAFALPEESEWNEPLSEHIRRVKGSGEYREALVRHFGEAAAEYLLDDGE